MESNHSDKSIDEPHPKRPKMDQSNASTSSSKPIDHFLSLPSEIVAKIIAYIPVAQRPSLELLDKNLQSAALITWEQIRSVNVDLEFFLHFDQPYDPTSYVETVESIMHKLVERSPSLSSLSGIHFRVDQPDLNLDIVQSIAQFERLRSITLGEANSFHGQQVPLESAVEFLETTRSRTSLNELRIFNLAKLRGNDDATILDRFAASFVNGREIPSPLMLEKFSFSVRKFQIRLDTLDSTRLTELCVGKAPIEPEQLINLIERALELRRIELAFMNCPRNNCNGHRQQANKELLTALSAHEKLTALKFHEPHDDNKCTCRDFGLELIEMLKSIGLRGQLRRFAMADRCIFSSALHMDRICAMIHNYMPNLISIKLVLEVQLLEESFLDIVGLTALEEIRLINWDSRVTGKVVEKIGQSQHLKRFDLLYMIIDKESSVRLVDVSTLEDLRIGHAHLIGADVFDRWADGFAANLRTLMLGSIGANDKNDELGLARFLEKASRLRVLILSGWITDRSIKAIAKSCPMLKVLGVRSNSKQITTRWLQEIVDRCPRLKRMGGFRDKICKKLRLPVYRKFGDVDTDFNNFDFDEEELA